jgi:hypothetical protein
MSMLCLYLFCFEGRRTGIEHGYRSGPSAGLTSTFLETWHVLRFSLSSPWPQDNSVVVRDSQTLRLPNQHQITWETDHPQIATGVFANRKPCRVASSNAAG